jgi:SsrA-binding protein
MKIVNRKFHREYEEIEKFEAGISLTGAEVKTVRAGNLRLEDAFVRIIGSEAYLINADIPVYPFARPQGYDSRRSRKLLLHKRELLRLKVKMAAGNRLTLAPVSCYNKGFIFKIEIALAKGRREVEKKKLEKQKDVERQQQREAKEYMKV